MYLITFVFFGLPMLDEFLKFDTTNPTPQEALILEKQLKFKIPLYLSIFLEYILSFKVLSILSFYDVPYFVQFTIIFGGGLFGGSNINIAHELIHKESNPIDSFLGSFALSKNLYQHFVIEHNYGHHKRVATPEDPATSKRGQWIFEFWLQTVIGSFKSAWKIEKERLEKKNKKIWSLQNKMIQYQINNIFVCSVVQKLFGFWGLFYFLLMALISILFLETVNYIEHYGLERKKLENGQYEKVNILHSWNAPHRITNYLLFKLQRHSDHHENSQKPYQILISEEKSPMLPNGYVLCIIMALFPPVWINVMEHMLQVWQLKNNSQDYTYHWNQARKKVRLFILFLGILCFIGLYIQIQIVDFSYLNQQKNVY